MKHVTRNKKKSWSDDGRGTYGTISRKNIFTGYISKEFHDHLCALNKKRKGC